MQPLEDDEDPLRVLGVDPDPVVGDSGTSSTRPRARRRAPRAARASRAELDRVRRSGSGTRAAAATRRPCTVGSSPSTTIVGAALLDHPPEVGPHALDERVAVDVGVRLLHPPHPRERQQVVDQVLHALRAVDREADVLVRARVELRRRSAAGAAGRTTRPCAAAPAGRARRRRRTARARWLERRRSASAACSAASSATIRARIASTSSASSTTSRRARRCVTSRSKSPRATSRTRAGERLQREHDLRAQREGHGARLSRITTPVKSTQNVTMRALSRSASRASARAGPSCASSRSTAARKRSNRALPASTCATLRGPPGFDESSVTIVGSA